ncbi:hypothetical protein K7640_17920 [Micromonospora sp. PLK6-60]|uniref:hypothetical protein n=1 Tax=Micromonospora sp. PLK6-60 TaxID=2873383 RepID=UPI001CA694C3|nr:hypothetical protein [Micromonospora sp. PLK6-60]MBY8873714.1 hypothetical protein [Micromonospora sp. PLK6-60]
MSWAGSLLVVLPVLALCALTAALRPHGTDTVAPLRLAALRAALVVATFAVLVVELLGAARALTRPAFAAAWLLFLGAAVALAWWRRAGRGAARLARERAAAVRDFRRTGGRAERLLAGAVLAVVLVELVVALLAAPNNFDSQTYHLPKVEHWVAQRSLEFWPTAIHRQVTIPPGAEYLLLHLRLLTGGDGLHNLVQWAAALGCLLAVTRVTAQLGGGRRAQLLTAFVLATTPMVVLQATSTQTDLVVAAWAAGAATLALDGLRRRAGLGSLLALGAATGLTALTKTSGLIAVGPLLLLWGVAQLRLARRAAPPGPPVRTVPRQRRAPRSEARALAPAGAAEAVASAVPVGGLDPAVPAGAVGPADAVGPAGAGRGGAAGDGGRWGRGGRFRAGPVVATLGGSLLVMLVAAVVVGPFLARETAEFGHPLGPPRLRDSIPMERHDPAAVLVNLARIGHTALDTPLFPLSRAGATVIADGARAVGVDPQDRAITFGNERFPVPAWYPDEDRAAFPVAGSLALLGAVLALARPRRISPERAGALRAYAVVVVTVVLLHASMIKWQTWGNRLLLYALVVAVPLAGLWLDALFQRRAAAGRRSVAAGVAVAVLAGSALAGALTLAYGYPRRLLGAESLLTSSDWETRFVRRPQWAADFRWAAAGVRDSGARRIGLSQQYDNWEYPWWLLLRDADGRPPELVALQSVLPDRPPADPSSVDAIVCSGSRPECAKVVPAGWSLRWRGYTGYALPPGR